MPDLVLHVGSRGGGYAALLYFSVIFATLGGVAAWEYRKQRLGVGAQQSSRASPSSSA
jgi:hypothetical protein